MSVDGTACAEDGRTPPPPRSAERSVHPPRAKSSARIPPPTPAAAPLDIRAVFPDDHDVITVAGTIDGTPVSERVDDGVLLTSDRLLAQRVEEMLAWEVRVGLGPWVATAGLDDPRAVRLTLDAALDPGTARINGPALPVESPIPAGAES